MSKSSPSSDSLTADENAFITPVFTSVKPHGESTPYTPFKSKPLTSSSSVHNLSSDIGVYISSSQHPSTSFSSPLLTRSMQGYSDDTDHTSYASRPSLSPLRLVPSQPSPLSVVPSPPTSAPTLSSSPLQTSFAPLSSIPSTSSALSATSTTRSTASTRRFMHFTFGANITGADAVDSYGNRDDVVDAELTTPNLPIAATVKSDMTHTEDVTSGSTALHTTPTVSVPTTSARTPHPHPIATSADLTTSYPTSTATSTSPTSATVTSSFSCSAPPFLDLPALPSPTTRDIPSTSSTSSLSPSPPPSSLSQSHLSTSSAISSSSSSPRASSFAAPFSSNPITTLSPSTGITSTSTTANAPSTSVTATSTARQPQGPNNTVTSHPHPSRSTTHTHQTSAESMQDTPNTHGLSVSLSHPHLSPSRTQQSVKKPSKPRLLPSQTPASVQNTASHTRMPSLHPASSPTKPGKNISLNSPKYFRRTSVMTPAASPPTFKLRTSSVLPTSPRNLRRKSSLFASPALKPKSRKSTLYLSSPPTKTRKSTILASSPHSIKRKSSVFASSPRSTLRKRSGAHLTARIGLSPRSLGQKKNVLGNSGDVEEDNDEFIPEIRVTGGEDWEDSDNYGCHSQHSLLPNTYSSKNEGFHTRGSHFTPKLRNIEENPSKARHFDENTSKARVFEGILSPRRAVRSRLSTLAMSTGPPPPTIVYASTTPYTSTGAYAAPATHMSTAYTPITTYTSASAYSTTDSITPAAAYMAAGAHSSTATSTSATICPPTSVCMAGGRFATGGTHCEVDGDDVDGCDHGDNDRDRSNHGSGRSGGRDGGSDSGICDDKDIMVVSGRKAEIMSTILPTAVAIPTPGSTQKPPTAVSLLSSLSSLPSSSTSTPSTLTIPATATVTAVTPTTGTLTASTAFSSPLNPPSGSSSHPSHLPLASMSSHPPPATIASPLQHPTRPHPSIALSPPLRSSAFTSPQSQHPSAITISSPQHPSSSLILSPREHVSAALASPRHIHPLSLASPRQNHARVLASPRQRRSVALASPRQRRSVLLASPQTQQRRSLLLSSPLHQPSLTVASPTRKHSTAFFSPSAKHIALPLSPRRISSLTPHTPRGKHSLLPHTPHRQQSLAPQTPHRMSTLLPHTPHRTISAIATLSPRYKHTQNHTQNQGQSQKQAFFPQTPRRGLSLAPFSPRRKPSLAPYSPRRRPSVAPYSPRRTQRHSTLTPGNFTAGNSGTQKSGPGKYLSPRRFSQVPGKCMSPRRSFPIPAPTATVHENISGLWRQLAPQMHVRSSLEHYATAVAALRIHLADAIRSSASEIAISSTHQYMSPHLVWALQQMAFIQDTEVLLRLVLQRVKTLSQLKSVYDRQMQRVAVHDVGTKLADDLCKLLSAPVLKLDREIMAKIPDSFEHVSAAIMEQGRINAEQAQHLSKTAFPTASPSSVTAAAFHPSTNTCPVHTAPHVPLKLDENTILPVLHVDVVTEAFKQTFELDAEEEGRERGQRNAFAEAFDVPERPKMPFSSVIRDNGLEEEEDEDVEIEEDVEEGEGEEEDDEVEVEEEDGEVQPENTEDTSSCSLPSSSAPIPYPTTPTLPSHSHLHLDICSPASPASIYSPVLPTHTSVASTNIRTHVPARPCPQTQTHVDPDVRMDTNMGTDTQVSGILSPGIANLKKNPTRSTLKSPLSLASPRTRVGKVEFHTPEKKTGKSRKSGKYGFQATNRVENGNNGDEIEEGEDVLTALPLSSPPRKHTQLPSTFSSPFSPSPFSPSPFSPSPFSPSPFSPNAATDTAQSVHLHAPSLPFSPPSLPPSPSPSFSLSHRTKSGKSRALYLSPNPRLSIPRVQPPRKRLSLSYTHTNTALHANIQTQTHSRVHTHSTHSTHATHSRSQQHTHSTAMHSPSTFSSITNPNALHSQGYDATLLPHPSLPSLPASLPSLTPLPSIPDSSVPSNVDPSLINNAGGTTTGSSSLSTIPPVSTATSEAATTLLSSPTTFPASLASPTTAQTHQTHQMLQMMRNRASMVLSPRGGTVVTTPRSIWAHFKAKSMLLPSTGGETKGKSGNVGGFPSPSLSGFERRTTVESANLPHAAINSGRGSLPFQNPAISRESVLLTPTRRSPPLRKSRRFTKLSPNFPNPTLSSPKPPSTLVTLPSFGSPSSSLPLSFADDEPHLYSILLALPTSLSSLAQTCLSRAITAGAAVPVLDSECKKTVAVVTFNQLVAESSLSLSRAEHISCLSRLERTFCLPIEAPTRVSSTRRQLAPLMPVCVGPCWFGIDMHGQPTVKRVGVEIPIRTILRPSTQLSSAFWERVPLEMVMGCELDAVLAWGKVEMVENQCLPMDLSANEEEMCRTKTTEMGLGVVAEVEEEAEVESVGKNGILNGISGMGMGTDVGIARVRQTAAMSTVSQRNNTERNDNVKGRQKTKGEDILTRPNDKLAPYSGKNPRIRKNKETLSGKHGDNSRNLRELRGVRSIAADSEDNGGVWGGDVYHDGGDGEIEEYMEEEEEEEEEEDVVDDEEKENQDDDVFSYRDDDEEKLDDGNLTDEVGEEAESDMSSLLPLSLPLPLPSHSHPRILPLSLPAQLLEVEWEESDVVFPELRSRQPVDTSASLSTHIRPVEAGKMVPMARALKIQNLDEDCDWENSDLVIRKNKVGIPKKTSLGNVDGEIPDIQTISQTPIRPRPLAFTTLSENDEDAEISEFTKKSGFSHLSMPSSMRVQLMKAEEGLAIARRFVRGSINIYSDTVHEDMVELQPGKVSQFSRQHTHDENALSMETISMSVDDDAGEIIPVSVHKQPQPRAFALQMAVEDEGDDGEVQIGRKQGSKHLSGRGDDTSNTKTVAARRISLLEHAGEEEFLMQHVISHQNSGKKSGLHSRRGPGHLGMQIQCLAQEEDVCVELFSPSTHLHTPHTSTQTGYPHHHSRVQDFGREGAQDGAKQGKKEDERGRAGQLRVERLSVGYGGSEVPVNVITTGNLTYMNALNGEYDDGGEGNGDNYDGNGQYIDGKRVFRKDYTRNGAIPHGVARTIEQIALDGSEVDTHVRMHYVTYDGAQGVAGVGEGGEVVEAWGTADNDVVGSARRSGNTEDEVQGQRFESNMGSDSYDVMGEREKRGSVGSRVKRGRDGEDGWRSAKRMSVCRSGSVESGDCAGECDSDNDGDCDDNCGGDATTPVAKGDAGVVATNASLSPSLAPEFTSPFASPFASPFTSPSRLPASTTTTKAISYGVASGRFTSPSAATSHVFSSPEKSKKNQLESPVVTSPYQRMCHRLVNQGEVTDDDDDNSHPYTHQHNDLSSEFETADSSAFGNSENSDIGAYRRPYSSHPNDRNMWSTPPRSRHTHGTIPPRTTNISNSRIHTSMKATSTSTVIGNADAASSRHPPPAPRPSRPSSVPSHYSLTHIPLFTTASARIRVDDALARVPVPFLRADQAVSAVTLTRILRAHARMSSALQQVRERLNGAVCGARSVIGRMLQGQSSCTIVLPSDIALYSGTSLRSDNLLPSDLRFAATACMSDNSVLIHALPAVSTAVTQVLLHFRSCVMLCRDTAGEEDGKRESRKCTDANECQVEKVCEPSPQEMVYDGAPVKILLHLARIIEVRGCSGNLSIIIRMKVGEKYRDTSALDASSLPSDLSILSLSLLFDSRDRYNNWFHGLTLLMATQGVDG